MDDMPQAAENMRGSVYEMQLFLQGARAELPCIPFVSADGIYGPETAEAVQIFQSANGLTPTGVTDQQTWDLARALYYKMLRKNAPPSMPNVFSCMDWDLSPEECCDQVYVVQLMLRHLGTRYQEFMGIEMTGTFDEATQKAMSLLCVDGVENYQIGKCVGKCQMSDLTKTYNCYMMGEEHKIWDVKEDDEQLEGITFQMNSPSSQERSKK